MDSLLYSHNIEMHPDEQMVPRDWKMRVTGTYPRPLLRLCSEGVAITRALEERDQGAKVVVINSKKEFNQPGTIVQKFGKLHTPNLPGWSRESFQVLDHRPPLYNRQQDRPDLSRDQGQHQQLQQPPG